MKTTHIALAVSAALYVAATPLAFAQTTEGGNKQGTEQTGGANKTDSGMQKSGGASSGGTQNSNEGTTLAGKKKGQN